MEIVINAFFLAKVFGHGDAADRLLDVAAHRRPHPAGQGNALPGDAPERQRHKHDYRLTKALVYDATNGNTALRTSLELGKSQEQRPIYN